MKPTQEMDDYISLEIARGRNKVPAYAPSIAPNVADSPRPVTSKEHQSSVTRWRTSPRQAKDNPSSIPMQAWLLYHLRFFISDALAGAWAAFGGLDAQLNRLAISMDVSITDSAAMALSYDRLVRGFLGERDRSRRETTTGGNCPIDFLPVENPAMKLRATAEHPSAAVPTQVTTKESTARQTMKDTVRNTAPKNRSRIRPRPRSVKKSAKRSRSRPLSAVRRKSHMKKEMETRR